MTKVQLKKDEDKIQTILDFYNLTNKLKDVVRTGWKKWNVKRERVESIAEHIYGTCMLALAIWSETLPDVNISEVVTMLALHETEEIIIGDITPFDTQNKLDAKSKGEDAVCKVFKNLIAKDVYFKLIHDFDTLATPEAKFAHECDKLEADLQAKRYGEDGSLSIKNKSEMIKQPFIKEQIKKGIVDIPTYFIIYDRKHFEKDDIFYKINTYIEKNPIVKKENNNE